MQYTCIHAYLIASLLDLQPKSAVFTSPPHILAFYTHFRRCLILFPEGSLNLDIERPCTYIVNSRSLKDLIIKSFVCYSDQMFIYSYMVKKERMLRYYSIFHSSSLATLTWLGLQWIRSLSRAQHLSWAQLGKDFAWDITDAGQLAHTDIHIYLMSTILFQWFLG